MQLEKLNDINIEKENNLLKLNEIEKNQKIFLETNLGKVINSALNVGLRFLLPDLIENQVIEIKDSLIQNGLKEGIQTAIQTATDFGKSILGIATGKFENINQMQNAVTKGGIIDQISNGIDFILNKTVEKEKINKDIVNTIKTGKNVILDNINNNIEKMFIDQIKSIEKIEIYSSNWNQFYNQKDFLNMEKEYKKLQAEIKKVVPLENTISAARKIENIHNLIKNNGQNFNLSNEEKMLSQILV